MGRFTPQLLYSLFIISLIETNINGMNEGLFTPKSTNKKNQIPQTTIVIKRELQDFVFYRIQKQRLEDFPLKELGRLSECSCTNILMLMHFNRLPSEVQRYTLSLLLKDLLSRNFHLSKAFPFGVHIHLIRFTPCGAKALTKPRQGVANVWNLIPENCTELTGYERPTHLAQLSKDGTKIITLSNDDNAIAHIWNATTGNCLFELKKHAGQIGIVKFNFDSTRALMGSIDGTVSVWDVTTGECLAELKGHVGVIFLAKFSPDGIKILTKSEDMIIRLWDSATGCCVTTLTSEDKYFIAHFSPDATKFACGSEDATTSIWNNEMNVRLKKLKHLQSIFPIKFSPDSKKVLTLTEKRINPALWDITTGELLVEFQGHTASVYAAKFSPDGTLLITGSEDKTIKLWDIATGSCLRDLLEGLKDTERPFYPCSIKFSPDGTKILISSTQNERESTPLIRLWELPCEAYEWSTTKANLFQAVLIAKAWKAKQANGFLVINENSPEYEAFMTLPSFVQEYIKTSYSVEITSKIIL